jgi:hypothetical protein
MGDDRQAMEAYEVGGGWFERDSDDAYVISIYAKIIMADIKL